MKNKDKCPHCLHFFWATWNTAGECDTIQHQWTLHVATCPACNKDLVYLRQQSLYDPQKVEWMAYPQTASRTPLAPEVPNDISADYCEACTVLNLSPKSSAALSRRCLQQLLAKAGKTKDQHTLAKQIDEVLPTMPPYIRPTLDAVRNIGNIAAHPMQSQSTGEIVEVEPHEAELLLEVLEQLFDLYFVKPAETQKRLDAINAKLKDAGKPPLKT